MDRVAPTSAATSRDDFGRAATAKEELAAEAVVERGEAVVEPPALRRADAEIAGAFVIEHEQRHDSARRRAAAQRARD